MFFLTRPNRFISGVLWRGFLFLFKLTADLEGVEAGLVGDEGVELLLCQLDDFGHLCENLLYVCLAWGDTVVVLDSLVDGRGDGVGFAAELDGVAVAHLLAFLGDLVGLCDLALEVVEVLHDLLDVRHFDGGVVGGVVEWFGCG